MHLHGHLEGLKVEFPDRPLADDGLIPLSGGLAVVGDAVLVSAVHAGSLQPQTIISGHLAGQQRILGEILGVPAI